MLHVIKKLSNRVSQVKSLLEQLIQKERKQYQVAQNLHHLIW